MKDRWRLCLVYDGCLYYSGCRFSLYNGEMQIAGMYMARSPKARVYAAERSHRFGFKKRGLALVYLNEREEKQRLWLKFLSGKTNRQMIERIQNGAY